MPRLLRRYLCPIASCQCIYKLPRDSGARVRVSWLKSKGTVAAHLVEAGAVKGTHAKSAVQVAFHMSPAALGAAELPTDEELAVAFPNITVSSKPCGKYVTIAKVDCWPDGVVCAHENCTGAGKPIVVYPTLADFEYHKARTGKAGAQHKEWSTMTDMGITDAKTITVCCAKWWDNAHILCMLCLHYKGVLLWFD